MQHTTFDSSELIYPPSQSAGEKDGDPGCVDSQSSIRAEFDEGEEKGETGA